MNAPISGAAASHAIAPADRLMSLDALRGFDMMWIVGADALGHALGQMNAGPLVQTVATQLDHVAWAGFRFYDLIFPLFVFMIGVAITFSLGRLVERQGRRAAVLRIVRRTCLLYLLGLFYYGGISKGFDHIRWLGVLQRLALCYGFAGICFVYLGRRALAVITVALLLGYWAMLTFVPVPGFGAGDFAEGHNLTNWIDQHYLPGFKWDGDHDPEGILSTLPAFASCLLGVFAGLHLQSRKWSGDRKAALLTAAGIASLVLGYAWGLQFPIVKKLWSSSFVLVAGGWSALLLALFYYVIDVRGIRAWAVPFTWIGTNALAIYLISNVVDFDTLSKRFAGGSVESWCDTSLAAHSGEVVLALVGLTLCFLICRFLHRRQIFLRL
jgi:predicted acyltransferase